MHSVDMVRSFFLAGICPHTPFWLSKGRNLSPAKTCSVEAVFLNFLPVRPPIPFAAEESLS